MSVEAYYAERDAVDTWVDVKRREVEQFLAEKGFHACNGNVFARPRHATIRDRLGRGRILEVSIGEHELVISLFSRRYAALVEGIARTVLEQSNPQLNHIPPPLHTRKEYDRFWCRIERG